ncbi:MAG: hypothetical protein HZY75_03920 [Nocardioidaceae bacterium]|nr:MAG: hypothetical protein HZY75_03920 [Nocardioidaceae bacterium]
MLALVVGIGLLSTTAPAYGAKKRIEFRFTDDRIGESSALVDAGENVITVNDSGDHARVFLVSKTTGDTIGVTSFQADVDDVEALAAGPKNTLWVGDIGDNRAARSHVRVYEIPMPTPGDRVVRARAYELAYRDGPRDAEAMLIHPVTGRLFVISKGMLGGTVYTAPKLLRSDRTNMLKPVGSAPAIVTDGQFLPDGKHIVVRDYWSATLLRASDFAQLGSIRLARQRQGEGLAIDGDDLLLSSEGVGSAVLRRPLPPRILKAIDPSPSVAASPSGGASEPETDGDPESAGGWSTGRWDDWVPYALGAGWAIVLGGAVTWLLRRRGSAGSQRE